MTSTQNSAAENPVILEVNDLRTYFFNRTSTVKAVDGINFNLRQGETLGIVGESGCGKTITALSLLGLVPKPEERVDWLYSIDGQSGADVDSTWALV